MTDWRRIDDLFDRALTLEGRERADFLERACGSDAALRATVEALLEADQLAGDFLHRPLGRVDPEEPAAADLEPPERIGPYRLLSLLEEGGMGRVYLAARTDQEFERFVAIKLPRPDRDGAAFRSRFRRERQILAGLEHPSIARLYEGGSLPSGQPYLVMELVDGMPIDDYCDHHRLGIEERLRLFLEVCEAVDYAHRNFVVHRDLKPGNIRVDAEQRPRLLDFGIAKLLEADPEDETGLRLTAEGDRLLTPLYASPEQVRGERVTPASDVYSLGVLLFRLLCGSAPFAAEDTDSRAAIDRATLDVEPRRPSSALTTTASRPDEESDRVLELRRCSPRAFTQKLRGDLDSIILQALRKEPEERYRHAGEMAADLRRHLEKRPIAARAGTFRYRAGRFVSRHRLPVALASVLLAALIVLAVNHTLQSHQVRLEREEAEKARLLAEAERRKAEEVSELLLDLFAAANPWREGGALTLRQVVDQAAEKVESLEDQPEVQVASLTTLGRVQTRLGEFERAEEILQRAEEISRSLPGAGEPPLQLLIAQGAVHSEQRDYDAAEAALRRALASEAARSGREAERLARAVGELGLLFLRAGRLDQAEPLMLSSLELLREADGGTSADYATALHNLGGLRYSQGDLPASLSTLEEALELRRRIFADDSMVVAESLGDVSTVLSGAGRLEEALETGLEALEIHRANLPEGHARITTAEGNLAGIYSRLHRFDEAVALRCRAYRQDLDTFGSTHELVGGRLHNLSNTLYQAGDVAAALEAEQRALEVWTGALGEEHWKVSVALFSVGWLGGYGDHSASGVDELRRSVEIAGRTLGQDHTVYARNLLGLGRGLLRAGDPQAAEPVLAEARQRLEASGNGPSRLAFADYMLGAALSRLGRLDEAERLLEPNLEILQGEWALSDPRRGEILDWLAEHQERQGRPKRAAEARQLRRRLPEPRLPKAAERPVLCPESAAD